MVASLRCRERSKAIFSVIASTFDPLFFRPVTDMLANVLKYDDGDEDDAKDEEPTTLQKKAPRLKKKVLAVTKLLRMYKMLRKNSEDIVTLKQLTPNHRVPLSILSEGGDAIQKGGVK